MRKKEITLLLPRRIYNWCAREAKLSRLKVSEFVAFSIEKYMDRELKDERNIPWIDCYRELYDAINKYMLSKKMIAFSDIVHYASLFVEKKYHLNLNKYVNSVDGSYRTLQRMKEWITESLDKIDLSFKPEEEAKEIRKLFDSLK